MKTIYILTNSKDLIPQRAYERESLNLELIQTYLEKNKFNVKILSFNEFINNNYEIDKNYFFYASSQYSDYKDYIHDILLYIKMCGGILIPNFNSFISHENKMFQELEMNRLNIISPESYIIGTYEEGIRFLNNTSYPMIAKKSKGFGSKTVQKINNIKEGQKFLKNNLGDGFIFNVEYFKWLFKKIIYNSLYPKYHGKVIFQNMINGLDHDWKVLIFFNKCFVLKRFTKKNDFRASGSGNFDYTAIPNNNILSFAFKTIKTLDVPFASLDIVEKNNKISLIEYQTVHFGLLTALNGSVYYELNNEEWEQKEKENISVDSFFAEAIVNFINYKEIQNI